MRLLVASCFAAGLVVATAFAQVHVEKRRVQFTEPVEIGSIHTSQFINEYALEIHGTGEGGYFAALQLIGNGVIPFLELASPEAPDQYYVDIQGVPGGGGEFAANGHALISAGNGPDGGDGKVMLLATEEITFNAPLEGTEQSEPAAPVLDAGRIFFQDNGIGKTQLCVRFNTGPSQCFATEP